MVSRPGFGLIFLAMIVGCGGIAQPTRQAIVGPHQGPLIKLPDDLGFVEVVTEARPQSPRSLTEEVVAYFLGPDSKSPLKPPPSEVSLRIYLGESKTMANLALKPDDKSAKDVRFAAVAPPGFDGTLKTGRINARLGGRDVDLAF